LTTLRRQQNWLRRSRNFALSNLPGKRCNDISVKGDLRVAFFLPLNKTLFSVYPKAEIHV
jgi:hypothetical protein